MGMFTIFPKPSNLPTAQYTQLSVGQLGYAVPFQRRNSQWQQVPGAETSKAVNAAGVANAGFLVIWTPPGGTSPHLVMLSLSTSVAGRIDLLYNGTVIWSALCPAATPVFFPISSLGMFMAAVSGNLTLQNNTGGASDLRANAWGSEIAF